MKALTAVFLLLAVTVAAQQRVDIVSVTGCLREPKPGEWRVVNATDPVPSVANAPVKAEMPTAIPSGKNEFQLIGVGEFRLPTFKDKTVVVKGLFIKAAPVSRLNITSVVEAFPACGPA